ncbi:hypothetical protein OIU35_07135 [Boseaceae bacterium BT-24-1]|nr:hypothetical protein [Boseaceae bacterium BT-24-1]
MILIVSPLVAPVPAVPESVKLPVSIVMGFVGTGKLLGSVAKLAVSVIVELGSPSPFAWLMRKRKSASLPAG